VNSDLSAEKVAIQPVDHWKHSRAAFLEAARASVEDFDRSKASPRSHKSESSESEMGTDQLKEQKESSGVEMAGTGGLDAIQTPTPSNGEGELPCHWDDSESSDHDAEFELLTPTVVLTKTGDVKRRSKLRELRPRSNGDSNGVKPVVVDV